MKVYFVRHGETTHNARGIHQHPDTELSTQGKQQMELTAGRFAHINITKFITSDMTRAKQSANILSRALELPYEESALFREVRRPSVLFNQRHYSLSTLTVGLRVLKNFNDRSWRHSDEENPHDVTHRAEKARTFLEDFELGHEHVLVVSHAFFINAFIEQMCAQGYPSLLNYFKILMRAKTCHNGSITTLELKSDLNPKTCDWRTISYNDHEHLGT